MAHSARAQQSKAPKVWWQVTDLNMACLLASCPQPRLSTPRTGGTAPLHSSSAARHLPA